MRRHYCMQFLTFDKLNRKKEVRLECGLYLLLNTYLMFDSFNKRFNKIVINSLINLKKKIFFILCFARDSGKLYCNSSYQKQWNTKHGVISIQTIACTRSQIKRLHSFHLWNTLLSDIFLYIQKKLGYFWNRQQYAAFVGGHLH